MRRTPVTAHDVADVIIFSICFAVLVYAAAGGWAG
jgi:hypothetical protein